MCYLVLHATPYYPGHPKNCLLPLLDPSFQASPHLGGWPVPKRYEASLVQLTEPLLAELHNARFLAECQQGFNLNGKLGWKELSSF
jgi:hypothetical protein